MEVNPETEAIMERVKASAVENNGKYVIGVDIGGTNTRVAVASLDGHFCLVAVFKASTVTMLLEGLKELIAPITTKLGSSPYAACLDIAGPVSDNGTKAVLTNYSGTLAERTITTSIFPPELFPKRTRFVNDLESCCYGILGLEDQNKLGEFFEVLWGAEDVKIAPLHHAVLSAGTGLGVGLLIKLGNRPFQVYPIEYGHATIPPLGLDNPDRESDLKLLDYLSKTLYDGKHAPEYEDVVSGRGLVSVYNFLVKDIPGSPALNAGEIAAGAAAGDKHALKAVEIHYRILVRNAQNVCAAMNVKGIFFAGDNQVDNAPVVKSIVKTLKEDFLNHPKLEWIENVPVFAQSTKFNINLYGTIFVARLDAVATH